METKKKFDLTSVDHDTKAELRNGSNICQCAGCGCFFSGISPFDRHFIELGTANPRCMSGAEMLTIGMAQNKNGVWQYGKPGKKEDLRKEGKAA